MFQLAIEKYEEMFPAFTDSRELKLLKVIHTVLLLICFYRVLSHFIMKISDIQIKLWLLMLKSIDFWSLGRSHNDPNIAMLKKIKQNSK